MSSNYRPRSGISIPERCTSAVLPVMKMRLENEIVRKREAETRRSETARSNDRYFQQWHVHTEKFDDWTSPRSRELSHRHCRERESEIEVDRRHQKLKKLYQEEKAIQLEELRKLKEEREKEKWEKMKDKIHSFRHSKNLKLKEIVEHNQHEMWKSTNPSFRAYESELRRQQQQEAWQQQLKEKEEEKRRQAEDRKKETAQLEVMIEEEKEKELLRHAQEVEKKQKFKRELDEQMELLKRKDAEADEKKKEHDRLLAEALALEAINEEMKKKEEERARRKRNGEFLTKQHLAKLRQRSKEVTAELDSEISLAERIFPSERTDASKDKEKLRIEILRYLQLVEHHRKLEKERLQQTDFLFQEEAKRIWDKREQEWEAERLARKKLIDEVISTQKKQINDKIVATEQERELLLREREELITSFETYCQELKSKEATEKAKKAQTKLDLLSQIDNKSRQEEEKTRKEERERRLEEERQAANNEKHWGIAMDRLKL